MRERWAAPQPGTIVAVPTGCAKAGTIQVRFPGPGSAAPSAGCAAAKSRCSVHSTVWGMPSQARTSWPNSPAATGAGWMRSVRPVRPLGSGISDRIRIAAVPVADADTQTRGARTSTRPRGRRCTESRATASTPVTCPRACVTRTA